MLITGNDLYTPTIPTVPEKGSFWGSLTSGINKASGLISDLSGAYVSVNQALNNDVIPTVTPDYIYTQSVEPSSKTNAPTQQAITGENTINSLLSFLAGKGTNNQSGQPTIVTQQKEPDYTSLFVLAAILGIVAIFIKGRG